MNAIIGEKLGMTQVFDDDSRAVPVTVIQAGPVRVVQVKREETDGYSAVQLGFRELQPHKAGRPKTGHFAKAGIAPHRHIVEVRVEDADGYEPGQEITVAEVFEKGQLADVAGLTRGKGFSGVMKRHNFSGQGASHGAHKVHRAPGSIGAAATPSRVFRGKRLPGRLGQEQRTVLNLEIVDVDAERNLLLVKGSVPGAKGSVVMVREAVKADG